MTPLPCRSWAAPGRPRRRPRGPSPSALPLRRCWLSPRWWRAPAPKWVAVGFPAIRALAPAWWRRSSSGVLRLRRRRALPFGSVHPSHAGGGWAVRGRPDRLGPRPDLVRSPSAIATLPSIFSSCFGAVCLSLPHPCWLSSVLVRGTADSSQPLVVPDLAGSGGGSLRPLAWCTRPAWHQW